MSLFSRCAAPFGLRLPCCPGIRLSGTDVDTTTFHSLELDCGMPLVDQFQLSWTEPLHSHVHSIRFIRPIHERQDF